MQILLAGCDLEKAKAGGVPGRGENGQALSGPMIQPLFLGPSGTAKTTATETIAKELGLDLYRIDHAGVVIKSIAETEKNLDRIFTTGENANASLLFDEAGALLGKRPEVQNSHDRYANI